MQKGHRLVILLIFQLTNKILDFGTLTAVTFFSVKRSLIIFVFVLMTGVL